jgi:hypothetical protein
MKERYQNPRVGDDINLRLLIYNANQFADINSIQKVEIWKLDDVDPCDKKTLIQTIDGASVSHNDTGQYSIQFNAEDNVYTVGKYVDVWYCIFEEHETYNVATIENKFEIVRDLWFTSPSPIIYDFSFSFRPNKIVQGSKQYLIVNIVPNVPRASDMETYYRNIAIASPLRISISRRCGDCLPQEEDLRLIVDKELIEFRESCLAYYFLDTTDLECGIYDIWFQLDFAENVYISPKSQLQIFV